MTEFRDVLRNTQSQAKREAPERLFEALRHRVRAGSLSRPVQCPKVLLNSKLKSGLFFPGRAFVPTVPYKYASNSGTIPPLLHSK